MCLAKIYQSSWALLQTSPLAGLIIPHCLIWVSALLSIDVKAYKVFLRSPYFYSKSIPRD